MHVYDNIILELLTSSKASNNENEMENLYHFLNHSDTSQKDTFGFKSRNLSLQINDLTPFENAITTLTQSIEFNNITYTYLKDQMNEFNINKN